MGKSDVLRCFGCQCMAAFPGLWLANGTFSEEFALNRLQFPRCGPGVGPVWDGKRGWQVHVRASKGAEPDPRVPLGWPKGDLRGAVFVSREIDRD